MPDPTEAKPSGVAYLLARIKGLWAGLYPLYELYQAVSYDQTITPQEMEEIIQALIVWGGVWLLPNLGYVRRLRDRYGRLVTQGVDDTVTAKLPESATTEGKHEFVDRDNDGVSDAEELRANDPTDAMPRVAARRLREGDTDQWNRP